MKILFVGNMKSSFIRRDYEILRKHFDVDVFDIRYEGKPLTYITKLLKIKHHVKNCDVIFGWFASWHTAFAVHYAKKYKKKSIVVVGGYDVAYEPQINYGAFTNIKEKIPAKYVLKNADVLLPFSNFSKKEITNRGIKPKNIKVVYMGIDTNKFSYSNNKESIAITVGNINKSNLKRKGIETFVKTAKHIPEIKFVVIGKPQDDAINYLKSIASENVKFTGFIPDDELIQWLQKAKVYAQLSFHEGFGVAIAEAMACGCIPVVTNRGALPEVVGNTGFYVPYGDEKATAEAIKKALNSPDELERKARERIVKNFPMEKREKELIKVIEEVIK